MNDPVVETPLARRLLQSGTTLFVLSLVLTAALATGLVGIGFNTSLNTLLARNDPYLSQVEEMDERFAPPDTVTFAVVTGQDSVFAPATVALLADLRDRAAALPGAQRAASLLEYRSPETGRALFSRAPADYSAAELQALTQTALDDPLIRNGLLSADARLTFVTVEVDQASLDPAARADLAQAILTLQRSMAAAYPDHAIHVTADVLFEFESRDAMLADLTSLLPLVILICVATICYCFHSFTFGFSILGQVGLTVLSTVGLLGHLGLAFNSVSVIAPLVVVVIAVAHSVHMISIFRQRLHRGDPVRSAMDYSIAYNFKPVLLATVTTAIGFLSLNLSSSPAIQDFGRIVALGVGFACLYTFTALPALLMWVTRHVPAVGRGSDAALPRWVIEQAKAIWVRHDPRLFMGCVAAAVTTAALLPLNQTDFNRMDFLQDGTPLRAYYDAVGEHMNRGPALTYGIEATVAGGAIEPEFLAQVDGFVEWLRAQPEVESAASLVEVVKTISRAKGAGDPSKYLIPGDVNTIAMDLSLYQSFELDDFPLEMFLDNTDSVLRLYLNAVPMSNQGIIDLDEKIAAGFADHLPGARLIHGSSLLLFARMDERVTVELLQGYSLSLVLITLTLIIGFRSVYYGLLSVLPNLLPATMVFGLWGLWVGQLDPFVMMLFSISIGLVVDDTVHILSHYLDHRANGVDIVAAVNRSLDEAGPALVVTTGVLALGNTLLMWANTLYFQQAAKLLVPIVVVALVLDLLFLPTVLKRFDRFDRAA